MQPVQLGSYPMHFRWCSQTYLIRKEITNGDLRKASSLTTSSVGLTLKIVLINKYTYLHNNFIVTMLLNLLLMLVFCLHVVFCTISRIVFLLQFSQSGISY